MKYLSIEDVLSLHDYMVDRYGGSVGVRDIGRLESVIASQSQEVFGQELYPTIYEKSAAIMRGIVQDHPFTDANKRSGTICATSLLEWNGFRISTELKELEDFAVRVAVEHLEIPEIAQWLESHSRSN